MSNSRVISISLPADMVARIDEVAASRYKSHNGKPNRSLLILDAIANHFKRAAADELASIRNTGIHQLTKDQPFAGSEISEVRVEAKTVLAETAGQLAESGHSLLAESRHKPVEETDSKFASTRQVARQTTYLDAIDQNTSDAIDQNTSEVNDRESTNQENPPPLDAKTPFPGSSQHSQAYQFVGKPLAEAKTDPLIVAWMRLFPGLEAAIDSGTVVGITGTDRGYRLTVTPELNPAIAKGLRWLGIVLETHTEIES